MLTVEQIKSFMDSDRNSDVKRYARIGQNYYEAKHDIMKSKIYFIDSNGNLTEDKTKSNVKISHPFFQELVDQAVQYMLSGKEGFIHSDDPDLQDELNEYFNDSDDFIAELYDVISDCFVKGFGYFYAFKNAEGKTRFLCADSLGVIEVRKTETADDCDYVIYYYTDRITQDNKKVTRIQVWDNKVVGYFCQYENGAIIPDPDYKVNPEPHIIIKDEQKGALYGDSYGFIPFFRLDNNKKRISSLKPIKDLIDDYDLMAAGLSNNIQDFADALYVVKGFQGDNLDELMMNIKAKKHVGVDEDGGIDIKTIDIPVEARKTKLELDEKNIYRFGFGLNTAGLKDTTATTNIAIKSAYSLLDLKCNKLEIRLKQFMRKIARVVLDEINKEKKTDYQMKDIWFDFQREVPINAQENAQVDLIKAQVQNTMINTLLNLASRLDNETIVKNICDILDIDYNEIKDRLPEPDNDLLKLLDGSEDGDVIE